MIFSSARAFPVGTATRLVGHFIIYSAHMRIYAYVAGGVGQASRAHIFAGSAAQNPYIFRIAGLRPAGTAGIRYVDEVV